MAGQHIAARDKPLSNTARDDRVTHDSPRSRLSIISGGTPGPNQLILLNRQAKTTLSARCDGYAGFESSTRQSAGSPEREFDGISLEINQRSLNRSGFVGGSIP